MAELELEIPTTRKAVVERQTSKRHLAMTWRKRSAVDLEETVRTSLMINAVHPVVDMELVQLRLVFDSNYLVTEAASRTHPHKAPKVADRVWTCLPAGETE